MQLLIIGQTEMEEQFLLFAAGQLCVQVRVCVHVHVRVCVCVWKHVSAERGRCMKYLDLSFSF